MYAQRFCFYVIDDEFNMCAFTYICQWLLLPHLILILLLLVSRHTSMNTKALMPFYTKKRILCIQLLPWCTDAFFFIIFYSLQYFKKHFFSPVINSSSFLVELDHMNTYTIHVCTNFKQILNSALVRTLFRSSFTIQFLFSFNLFMILVCVSV